MLLKRIFDFVIAIIGVICFLPLGVLFSLLIWLEDGGNVFYLQDRVGKYGKIFKSIKFRSMIPSVGSSTVPLQTRKDDPRITKIGRRLRAAAMDELPQLINIAKGEMSFVGPRALRPEEKEVGSDKIVSVYEFPEFKERCAVKPGLTGVAQVLLSRNAPREQKFKYDLLYIKNRSFWFDCYLIILSFFISLKGKWEAEETKIDSLCRFFKKGL